MKSEERHELKENSLSIWLQYGLPQFIKKNGSYLLLGVALCVLAFSLWRRHERSILDMQQNAAAELIASEGAGVQNRAVQLRKIIDHYGDEKTIKPIVALAYRDLGNYHLRTFATGIAEDIPGPTPAPRIDPNDALNSAESAFNKVLSDYSDQLLAAGSSKLGLAEVAINKRNWDGARKIYEELTDKKSPFGTSFAEIAAAKLKRLDAISKAPRLAVAPSTSPSTAPTPIRPSIIPPMPTEYGPRPLGPIVIPSATTQPK